tara:strand:+ start:1305 stop:2573 length:1269 start_codon:yes stop_codon:yes gene_type:complete
MKTVKPESVGIDSNQLKYISDFIDKEYITPGKMIGTITLIARSDEVAFVDCQGYKNRESKEKMTEDTIFRIFSMTKPITSVALMQLYEKSLFRLDDPVYWYIPKWKGLEIFESGIYPDFMTSPVSRHMTIRDLMSHQSGLTYHFMYRTNVDAAYRKLGIGAHGRFGNKTDLSYGKRGDSLDDMIDMISKVPLEFSPGDKWNYSVATDVLGYLVEHFSGKKLDTYFKENIFDPLEMKDTGFFCKESEIKRLSSCYQYRPNKSPILVDSPESSWTLQEPKFLSGGGGLVSTLSDYYNFTSMLRNRGLFKGDRILGRKSMDMMTSNHLPDGKDLTEMSQSAFSETPYKGVGFGLGFSVMLDPVKSQTLSDPGEFGWGGMASTVFWVNPVEDMIVIFLTQLIPSSSYQIRRELRTLAYSSLVHKKL